MKISLKRIEVVYSDHSYQFIVGKPIETITKDIKENFDPNKIVKSLVLEDETLKIVYGDNEIKTLSIKDAFKVHYEK
ncbi:hypothetical protein [Methanobrevibacter arboriphilus]|uniref:hypothetical protein n=1 Tax=Methanobrevibacter arboriphilus TaxID=39441 RepID=UPI0005B27A75|nr:hypothetical protein [Methanobrevibacter arboriphilus]